MAGKKRVLAIPTVRMGEHALNHEEMPDHTKEDIGRLIFKEVRRFFSDPHVQADYQAWLIEYRKSHPSEGGEMC